MAPKLRQIDVPGTIEGSPEIASAVRRATDLLQSYAPPSGVYVTADWRLASDDAQHPVLDLHMRDRWNAEASARFTLGDLANRQVLEQKINWLWGDLLQDRSHKQLAELQRTADTPDATPDLGPGRD